MKNKLLIIFFVFAGLVFSQTNYRTISVKPENSIIFLNGNRVSNYSEIEMNNDSNILLVYKNQYEWDANILEDTLILSGNGVYSKILNKEFIHDTLDLNYKFNPKIIIDTDPQNARVGDLGYTPISLTSISKPLFITKDYFETYLLKNPQPVNMIKLKFKGREVHRKFTESIWFPVLIGTAAILGGVSAYYKTKADKKYDEYQRNKIQSLLDETNRMDLISGVSLGILQINLGYIIYNLLFQD